MQASYGFICKGLKLENIKCRIKSVVGSPCHHSSHHQTRKWLHIHFFIQVTMKKSCIASSCNRGQFWEVAIERSTLKVVILTTLLKVLFWTGQKDLWPIYLGPIKSEAQIPHLAALLATHPFPAKGVHEASKTGSNEPQRLFACSHNKLTGGYTSHDFITARAWCAITTALRPPPLYI